MASRRWAVVLAWALAFLVFGAPIAALALAGAEVLGWKVVLVPWLLLVPGTLLSAGRPANPLGWCVLAVAGLYAGSAVATAAISVGMSPEATAWAAWYVDRGSAALVPVTLTALLLLPDGRLPSPRWRLPAVVAVSIQCAAVLVWALLIGPAAAIDTELGGITGLANPVGALPASWGGASTVLEVLLQAPFLLAVGAVGWRMVRGPAEDGTRLTSVLLAVGAFALLIVLGRQLWPAVADMLDIIGCALLSATLTAAVLRRRLAGVDVIVGHAFVYSVLTALVAGGYLLVVGLVGAADDTLPRGGIAVVAAAIALALLPLRSALQRLVHRLLFGETRDAARALRRLSASAADSTTVDDVLQSAARAIRSSLRADQVTLTVEGRTASAQRRSVLDELRSTGPTLSQDLIIRGQRRGELSVEYPRGRQFGDLDRELISDFADHVGRVADSVQLASEVTRSREAIVTAAEEERRRLRRDLHDDLGPTLAGLTMQLSGLEELIRRDPDLAASRAPRLAETSRQALDNVRRVSRGLRPPSLDELGLEAALAGVADRSGVAVDLHVTATGTLSAAVEVAAYRIGAEALTNVGRHSGVHEATLDLLLDGDHLVVRVRDAGRGLSPGHEGIGMASMRARAEEVGGTFHVHSSERGTTVEAQLPVPTGGAG